MKRVDYDELQYRVYAQGRAIAPDVLDSWIALFARYASRARPLAVLDLGSGVGRFTPALAREFGGPVYGIEPSFRMRDIALQSAGHDDVSYLDGRAERIPLPDNAVDFALMYLVVHHVVDKAAAALELARVLRPGGKLAIRTTFVERTPDLLWYSYFPLAREIEARVFPTVEQLESIFAGAGFELETVTGMRHRISDSLAEYAARMKLRAISTFEHMPEEEIVAGLERMEADAALETTPTPVAETCELMILTHRPG